MAFLSHNFSKILAGAAALSLTSSPVLAAQIGPSRGHHPGITILQDRGWGGGWGGGWGHHDDGPSGGDILAGLLVFGGIVAIASAASKRAQPAPPPPAPVPQNQGYGQPDNRPVWQESNSVDNAVDRCANAVSSTSRKVGRIDKVERMRDSNGWRVEGMTDANKGFTCTIGADGTVSSITVEGRSI